MKTIGLLGGMSWESTQDYYRLLNEGVRERLGGLHSAQICLRSVDFEPIEQMQREGDWLAAGELLIEAARSVAAGGADFLLICTNTMHKVAGQVQAALSIPLLHIADATAEVLLAEGRHRVGLLGTRFTMEQDFYRGRLTESYGIEVIVPDQAERETVNRIIYEELCLGQVQHTSRQCYLDVIASLRDQGAQAVILGCTEIAMLVQQDHTPVPLYDTTAIHAGKAVEMSLS